jgi:crotonobetainyl-CoA:carnitine CoA-transferase CaiB-like acyl-CoA transferase
VPIAPLRSLEQALDLQEVSERDMLVEYEHPVLGTVRSVGLPVSVGEYSPDYRRGPRLGEHGVSLLTQLGYSEAEIGVLSERGAFGPASTATRATPAPE